MKSYRKTHSLSDFASYGRECFLDQDIKEIVIVQEFNPATFYDDDTSDYKMFREMPAFSEQGWHANNSRNSEIFLAELTVEKFWQGERIAKTIAGENGKITVKRRGDYESLIRITKLA